MDCEHGCRSLIVGLTDGAVCWLVSLKKTLTLAMKVLVSVAYLIAAAMNLLGLYSSYTFAEALRTDLLRMAATTPLTDTRLILERYSYLPHRLAAFWIHLAVGATILLVIWLARFPGPEVAAAKAATSSAEGERSHERQNGA